MSGFPSPLLPQPTWWTPKRPLEALLWSEVLTPYVSPTDVIASVSASIAPTGALEMQAASIAVVGQTVSLQLTGGQPGRIYTVQFIVTMTNGAVYQPTAAIVCQPVLLTDEPAVAPVPGFGSAIVWSGGVVSMVTGFDGTSFLTATGTNQGTAAQIYAVTTVIDAGTGGVILPAISGLIYGTLIQTNTTNAGVVIYPASGDAFSGMLTNQGYTLASGATISETLVEGATSWTLQT